MDTAALIDEVIFRARTDPPRWGRPTTYSILCHAAALAFLPFLWDMESRTPTPVRVVEINVMGSQDLALKGTENDPSRGPSEDKTLMANPRPRPKRTSSLLGQLLAHSEKSASASAARSDASVAQPSWGPAAPSDQNAAQASQATPAPPVPKLKPRGPLFSAASIPAAGDGGGATNAETLYVNAGDIPSNMPAAPVKTSASKSKGTGGQGSGMAAQGGSQKTTYKLAARGPLFSSGGQVGGDGASSSGSKLYLTRASQIGGGGNGSGYGDAAGTGTDVPRGVPHGKPGGSLGAYGGTGSDDDVGGGRGSVTGGTRLERQGTAIMADYPLEPEKLSAPVPTTMAVPQADDFFAISGSLGKRRILKLKLPRYPRWAEEKGVEATIAVWLAATPQGEVESNLYIVRTSGYPEWDRLIIDVVKQIRFAPLPDEDALREDTGVATFNFKLKRTFRKSL